jgi:hypothetical protein
MTVPMLLSGSASAQRIKVVAPAFTLQVQPAVVVVREPVTLTLQSPVCNAALEPMAWHDQSDPLSFASAPLEQLTADDRAFMHLQPFVQLRLAYGSFTLNGFGIPLQSWGRVVLNVHDSQPGWRLWGC